MRLSYTTKEKNMKKLLTALTFLLIATATMAQQKKDDTLRKHRQAPVERSMHTELSQEQKEKMAALRAAYKTKLDAVNKSDASKEEKRKSVRELSTEHRKAIMQVYTPAQREEIKKKQEERKKLMKERRDTGKKPAVSGKRHRKGQGMRGNNLHALNLSETQKLQVTEIRKEAREKTEAVKNNTSLSEEARKAEYKKIKEAQNDKMQNVLTPEQKEKMKEQKSVHRKHSGTHRK